MSQRIRSEIAADLASVRAARERFLAGEAVTEVTRSGRTMRFAQPKLSDFNDVIAELIAEFEAAPVTLDAPRVRRRAAVALGWRN